MFLHRFQTQTAFVSNFLVAPPVADQSRQLLFSSGELDKMRQRANFVLGVGTKIFELDEKMRPGHAGRVDLLQTDLSAKMASRRMVNHLVFGT